MIADHNARGALGVVLIGFVALSLTYSIVSPPFENPDEINHAEYAAFIAEHRRLPDLLTDCVRLALHPPLYHALIAPLAAATRVGTEDVLVGHRLNPEYRASRVILLHDDPDETFPYAGRSRFVHIARAVTVMIAALSVVYVFKLTHLVLNDRTAAVAAAASVALVPQFQYISASVNHDAMAVSLAAGFLYYALLMIRAPSWLRAALAGGLLGAGLLVKSSFLVLAPVPLALWLVDRRRSDTAVVRATAASYAVALAVAGWWYAETALEWGDPLPLVRIHQATWVGYNLVRTDPLEVRELIPISKEVFRSFWFLAGLMNIPAHPLQYVCWSVVSMVALIGLIRLFTTRTGAVLASTVIVMIAATLNYNRYVASAQGRYLFVVLPILGLAVARGVATITPSRMRSAGYAILVSCLAVAAVMCAGAVLPAVYAGIRAGNGPTRLATPQLYCRNHYSQTVTSRGGELVGIRLKGRRIGDGTFSVELAVGMEDERREGRHAVVSSGSLTTADAPVEFRFAPLTVAAGAKYGVGVRAQDAHPFGRAAFAYTQTSGEGPLHFDGRPLHGNLEVEEMFARDEVAIDANPLPSEGRARARGLSLVPERSAYATVPFSRRAATSVGL